MNGDKKITILNVLKTINLEVRTKEITKTLLQIIFYPFHEITHNSNAIRSKERDEKKEKHQQQ